MAGVSPQDLATAAIVLIIASTYGDGGPPDNADALHGADAPSLASLRFAVLALGDSNSRDFCKCGRDFDTRLAALGATPLVPIIEADVDCGEPFARWLSQIDRALGSLAAA